MNHKQHLKRITTVLIRLYVSGRYSEQFEFMKAIDHKLDRNDAGHIKQSFRRFLNKRG